MNLFSEYFKCEGLYTLEYPNRGFATYKIEKQECYIRDVYVAPLFRNQGVCFQLGDEITKIAKSKGCNVLIGSVKPSYKDSGISLKMLQSYGMRVFKAQEDTILLVKEI